MKKIEDIEKEYKEFQIKTDYIRDYKDFIAFMCLGLEETYEAEKDFKKELKNNKRDEVKGKIRNIIFTTGLDLNYFKYDNNILIELMDMTIKYRKYFEEIIIISTEKNYQQLLKIMDFLRKYYGEHIDYFEYKRDKLEKYLQGIDMFNPKYEDNREVLYEFVDKKLSGLDKDKILSRKYSE